MSNKHSEWMNHCRQHPMTEVVQQGDTERHTLTNSFHHLRRVRGEKGRRDQNNEQYTQVEHVRTYARIKQYVRCNICITPLP